MHFTRTLTATISAANAAHLVARTCLVLVSISLLGCGQKGPLKDPSEDAPQSTQYDVSQHQTDRRIDQYIRADVLTDPVHAVSKR